MNAEIRKEDWKDTFDKLSKRRYLWKTKIEVLGPEFGDQILSNNLLLNGITIEKIGNTTTVNISVGETREFHQTHCVKDPSRVAILPADSAHGDIINIEQADGTKTLISILEPAGLLLGFYEEEAFAVSA